LSGEQHAEELAIENVEIVHDRNCPISDAACREPTAISLAASGGISLAAA
jgi:hypothetical protein